MFAVCSSSAAAVDDREIPVIEKYTALRSPYEGAVLQALAAGRFRLPERSPVRKGTIAGSNARVLGGIVPHHDIALDMVLRFYETLAAADGGDSVRRVFLFAPDHFRQAKRWVAVCPADWTFSAVEAFGTLSADREIVGALSDARVVEMRPEIFAREHGITLHIPLVARFFPDATVVPILLRPDIPDLVLLSFRERLQALMREGDLVILSMDLSHYKPPEEMADEDRKTLRVLTEMRSAETGRIDVDARRAAALATALFRNAGAGAGEVLERTDSSAILGRREEAGTSYATIVYRSDGSTVSP